MGFVAEYLDLALPLLLRKRPFWITETHEIESDGQYGARNTRQTFHGWDRVASLLKLVLSIAFAFKEGRLDGSKWNIVMWTIS